jgi:hypothetical protein
VQEWLRVFVYEQQRLRCFVAFVYAGNAAANMVSFVAVRCLLRSAA